MVYYNEIDPYAAQWLRNLIIARLIPAGHVDERDIRLVQPSDLEGYVQCHFFAGIGGFCLGLRFAGIDEKEPVWTGGPPCQDASALAAIHGKQSGINGPRIGLALVWLELIERCKPPVVVFENVPGFEKSGAPLFSRLGSAGYAVSRQKRTARSAGAPHIRRRLFAFAKRHGARFPQYGQAITSPASQRTWAPPPGSLWRKDLAGTVRLDDGLPARMERIRAFGNSVVPQAVGDFLMDHMEAA